MNISSYRKEYIASEISEESIEKDPITQFGHWMEDALASDEPEPTAMSLSTFGTDGFPGSRIVLLKSFNEQGFIFFTNYDSEKGRAILLNSAVGLLFFWPQLERQVRVSGFAEKVSSEISENYYKSRPLASRIAAWASEQSREIPSRKALENRFKEMELKFKSQEPPLPPFWGGFRVIPRKIEFWQGRANRLHDRILYEKSNAIWVIKRLAP